jgi:hypothetical protein
MIRTRASQWIGAAAMVAAGLLIAGCSEKKSERSRDEDDEPRRRSSSATVSASAPGPSTGPIGWWLASSVETTWDLAGWGQSCGTPPKSATIGPERAIIHPTGDGELAISGEHDFHTDDCWVPSFEPADPGFEKKTHRKVTDGWNTECSTEKGASDRETVSINITEAPATLSISEAATFEHHTAAGDVCRATALHRRTYTRDDSPQVAIASPSASSSATRDHRVTGSIGVGGAAVSGGTVSNASAVVAGMASGFRRCYNRGLQEDPNMKGTVRITAKIGPSGEVVSASPSGGGSLSGTVISCVAARVASAQFAPPDGGGATIVIPVSFSSS